MLQFRVIPCLLLSNSQLVKTVCFKKGQYIGDPINTIRIFNESGADEIILLDSGNLIFKLIEDECSGRINDLIGSEAGSIEWEPIP